SATCVFYDITKGNNSVPCDGGAAANCSATTNGVLISPGSTTTPAYTAAAGTGTIPSFDLAAGLGSVNVANLATKWPSAGLKATPPMTTVKGATPAVHINHAMTVILAAHVASTTTGTPTGDVSFNAPQGTPNAAIGFLTLDASGNTIEPNPNPGTKIPGGAYTLKAHYGGDQTFAQSDDA